MTPVRHTPSFALRRPAAFFGATLALLFGGTFAARIAHGDGQSAAAAQELDALLSGSDKIPPFPADGAVPLGTFGLNGGESAALRHIGDALRARPDRPVIVEWSETFRDFRVIKRARYVPSTRMLECQRGEEFYRYAPMTPQGIRAALRADGAAPFANAQLYSLPESAFKR